MDFLTAIGYLSASMVPVTGHRYTLAATGVKFKAVETTSRDAAKQIMYSFIDKHGIRVRNKWKDGHFVTYCCDNGIKFYINRM